jgi:hypothetical protein
MRDKEIERNEGETAWRNDETGLQKRTELELGDCWQRPSDFSAKISNFLVIRF